MLGMPRQILFAVADIKAFTGGLVNTFAADVIPYWTSSVGKRRTADHTLMEWQDIEVLPQLDGFVCVYGFFRNIQRVIRWVVDENVGIPPIVLG